MKPLKRLASFLLLSASLCLSSCGQEPEQSSSPADTTPVTGDRYDPDAILVADKEVTSTRLVTYEGPSLMETSSVVGVKVNGVDLFVYETRVNHKRKFDWYGSEDKTQAVLFDFEGKVYVEIEVKDVDVESAIVTPQALGIVANVIDTHHIGFYLEHDGNYVVEFNGDSSRAIHIFANPIEENPLTAEEAAKDPNTIYIGPGIYNAGTIPVRDGTTVYLAGGSYVYGSISVENVQNVTIRGRGIFSGEIYERRSEAEYTIPVVFRNAQHITIEDVAFFDPAGWTLNLYKCQDVKVNNVKIITARSNGDGISLQSCQDVVVKGGYVRSWDDSLVVKNVDRGNTSNILFDGVTVWTDLAQSMEVGYETYGATMDDITFQNITVLHNFHKAVISCHNCDDATITNLTYKNITVEDAQTLGDVREDGENDFLIDFTIAYNVDWTHSGGDRGNIAGVTIENVKVYEMADTVVARMTGESDASHIENVKIKGLEIEGRQITSAEDLGLLTNPYVSAVSFETMPKVIGSYHELPYHLALASDEASITTVPTVEQNGLLVPEFARYEGELAFAGVKVSGDFTASATHGAGTKTTTPGDDGSGDFSLESYPAANAIDGDRSTSWRSAPWKGEEDEFACLRIEFDQPITAGILRLIVPEDNPFYYVYRLCIFARKNKTTGEMNDNYTRLLSSKDYEMSPASGNAIDINLAAQPYGGFELRFYRVDSWTAPKAIEVSEVEFYPPSLSFNKAIVESTAHNDVYNVERIVDGDPTGTSYYESNSLPATIVIDLGDVYSISAIVLCLPPSQAWVTRTQEIEISSCATNQSYSSMSSPSFEVVKPNAPYEFNPNSGNRVLLSFEPSFSCRFLKLVIRSNDISGGYAAQLSEVSVYGTK